MYKALAATLHNPIKIDSIQEFLYLVLSVLMYILFPFVVLMMLYTGFLFVSAQGNPQKLDEAKRSLLWTTIGGVLVLGAYTIAKMIEATVGNF